MVGADEIFARSFGGVFDGRFDGWSGVVGVAPEGESTSKRVGKVSKHGLKTGRLYFAVGVGVGVNARVEYFLYVELSNGRTFDELEGLDFVAQLFALARRHEPRLVRACARVGAAGRRRVPQVHLGSHEYDQHTGYKFVQFGYPFGEYILHRVWSHHAVAQYNHVRFRIRHYSQRFPVFLQ